MEITVVRDLAVGLGQCKRMGRRTGGLPDVVGAALFQSFDQRNRFCQVHQSGIRSRRSLPARESFKNRHLGADHKIRVVNLLFYSFGNGKRKAAPVFPRTAVFPVFLVKGTQDLRTQVPVAELKVNAVRAHIVRDFGRPHVHFDDVVHFFGGKLPGVLITVQGLFGHAHPLGKSGMADFARMGQLENQYIVFIEAF
ncbi:hypothetical protein SDC9_172140 [bioreactor metagenome]|uniref:Uncharacterized protein n=1 Tax=bioreactor metagenome TaxID=1076179 RepID=A0A645GCW2_9ZZZZ